MKFDKNRESSSRRLDCIIREDYIPKIFQLKNLPIAFNGAHHLHASDVPLLSYEFASQIKETDDNKEQK